MIALFHHKQQNSDRTFKKQQDRDRTFFSIME
jgi:hypothetical protein